jgi:hypothetical protein
MRAREKRYRHTSDLSFSIKLSVYFSVEILQVKKVRGETLKMLKEKCQPRFT